VTSRAGRLRLAAESTRNPVVPNGVLGMTLFVAAETMLFAGLISAFTIIRSSAIVWPPPGQPRLPLEETAINTAALLLSGVVLWLAQRAYARDHRSALRPLGLAIGLGAFFVAFQGVEWLALVREGLTLTSSTLGSFFYLIVGMHALHAIGALGLLAHTWLRLRQGWLVKSQLAAAQVLWIFVVGLWPILYLVVYL
jgi:cytochrome c oxidase subunit 3